MCFVLRESVRWPGTITRCSHYITLYLKKGKLKHLLLLTCLVHDERTLRGSGNQFRRDAAPFCLHGLTNSTEQNLSRKSWQSLSRSRNFLTFTKPEGQLQCPTESAVVPYPGPYEFNVQCFRFVLILYLTSSLFPSGFLTKTFYTCLTSSVCAVCTSNLIIFDPIAVKIFGEKYKNYEVPHYASLCTQLLNPSLARMLPSVPCSQYTQDLGAWTIRDQATGKHYKDISYDFLVHKCETSTIPAIPTNLSQLPCQ